MPVGADQLTSISGRGQQRDDQRQVTILAWVTVLVGSAIAKIFCSYAHWQPNIWLPLIQTGLLIGLAIFAAQRPTLRSLVGFILIVTAGNFAWYVITPGLEYHLLGSGGSTNLSWAQQFLISRMVRLLGAVLMIFTLIGSGIGRGALFLRKGDLRARVRSESLLPLKDPISWRLMTLFTVCLFAASLSTFFFLSVRIQATKIAATLAILPWGLAIAAANSMSEEFQFRCAPLARLQGVVSPSQACLLAGVFFGMNHYFGQPGGWMGVVMAAVAGWVWAKSILETRGIAYAAITHFALDFLIFIFLALSGANFPKTH